MEFLNTIHGRDLLTLKNFSQAEIKSILDFSKELKSNKLKYNQLLQGKSIVMIFEKPSTRTRCAFEVAAYETGAHATNLVNSQLGKKESIADSAKVLSRFYDGIAFRGFHQDSIRELSTHATIPVWNALTDAFHPTQALADILTIMEEVDKPLSDVKVVFSGDTSSNVAYSLLITCAKLGINYVSFGPKLLHPSIEIQKEAENFAKASNAFIEYTDNIEAVKGADVLYTDVWVSMGQENKIKERINQLRHFQVNAKMIEKTQNPNVIFLHCLPACHDTKTELGKFVFDHFGLQAMEVTDEVFLSDHSKVIEQAENRMHTIKAVMILTLNE